MVSANRVVASGWMEASVVVFLLCYSAGLRLPLCRLSFVNPVHSFLPFCSCECSPVSLYHTSFNHGESLFSYTDYHTPLHPTTCYYPNGWHHTTFHCPHSSLYKPCIGLQVSFWILKPWGWDWYVVQKCQEDITTTLCVITQKCAGLSYLVAEPWNHEQFR